MSFDRTLYSMSDKFEGEIPVFGESSAFLANIMSEYRRLQLFAVVISILSVAYNLAEGGVSIGLGAGEFAGAPSSNFRL